MGPRGGSRELLGSGRVGSKEPVGQPATADVKRPHMLELEMRAALVVGADDDLRRAAAGICHGNALAGKIVGNPIECEPRLHLARDDLRRKAQSAHALSDLLVHPIIVREKGSGTREILERMLAAQGLELGDFASVIEVASIPVIKEFVRAGRGITFIYRVAVSEELSRGELVDLTPADCAAHHDFTLIWQQGSAYAESYRALLDEWRSDLL